MNKLINDGFEAVWADTINSLLVKTDGINKLFPKINDRAKEFDIKNLIVKWENIIHD